MAKWNFALNSTSLTSLDDNEQSIDIEINEAREDCEKVLVKARKFYESGRKALWKGICCGIIWYETSKDDEDYIKAVFKPFSSNSSTHPYTTTFKAVLQLDESKQASTITKYKDAAKNMMESDQFKDRKITDYSDELLDEMVAHIKNAGGIEALAKGDNEDKPKKTMKKTKVEAYAKAYREDEQTVYGKLSKPDGFETPESFFVSLVGRINGDEIEVVDIAANDDLIASFIRATKSND